MRLPFAAAAAIAAYLSVYLLAGGSSSAALQQQLGAAWCQQLAVPPMQLVSADKLAALLRLFKYRLGANGSPMLEAVEGVACRWDGTIHWMLLTAACHIDAQRQSC